MNPITQILAWLTKFLEKVGQIHGCISGRIRRLGGAPAPKPEPPIPDSQPPVETVSGEAVLLTCFENDQSLLLEDLNLGDIHETAYDTVIVHRRDDTDNTVYLLPPLLEKKNCAEVTWALLEGTPAPDDTDAIVFETFETAPNSETITLQAAHAKLLDADVYIGINLAVVPLSETHRDEIRNALLRLRKRFGEKLHIRKLQASVLADWPTQTRNTRNAIWKQIFHGVSRQPPKSTPLV